MRPLITCVSLSVALVFLSVAWRAADAATAESLPFEARVVTAGAPVRSGPAENYYLTETLPEDHAVEVYQVRPDGWCAIRPPETSFSWVFARHVVAVGDGLGRIDKDDVPSRIGSSLSNHRDVSQVALREGEIVRVIDEETHDGQTWYKIAPPAGEFRWIHVGYLEREGGANQETVAADAAWRPMARPNQPLLDLPASATSDDVHLASSDSDVIPADDPEAAAAAGSQGPASATQLPEEFGRQVVDLELRLSRMVAEPTDTWDVTKLTSDAEQLQARADSAEERSAAQALLMKINRFATIQRGYAQTGANAGQLAGHNAITPVGTANVSVSTGGVTAQPNDSNRFDAIGILRPVVSRRPGAPQFALVDERGQVVSFVTPSPDLNLQPYLGLRVGIVGTRGYMPEFQRNHVVAGRVSPLDSTLVR